MGQAPGDRDEATGPASEPFEAFYLREYPQVVGLLHGLLGSRLVAEELAQETFLVAYRDWDRISGLDNPRAWVRKVAVNQRGSFLRAYLRQQTRDRDATVRDEDDSIKLADDHAEVWQAVRTLPPLQAKVIALRYEDYSVAQVDAASRLREIVRRSDQLVAHGPTTILPDPPGQPQEPPMPLAPSPPSAARWPRRSQRLALAVNLLLVLALGIVIGIAATHRQDVASTAPTTAAPVVTPSPTPPETLIRTRTSVPDTCVDTAELADDIIARLTSNQRDNRLALALRDYTIASQACRKAASP